MLEKLAVNYINNMLKKHGIDIYIDLEIKEIENGFEVKVKVERNGNKNK